jgi:hypothetical protein
MQKLKLDLDDLELDTFQAAADEEKAGDGTVEAHAATNQFRCTYFCTYSACTGLPC